MSTAVKQVLSPKAVLIAMGLACLTYLLMLVLSLSQGMHILEKAESDMAAQSIVFDRAVGALHADDKATPGDVEGVSQEDLSKFITASKEALAPAPFEGLTEKSSFGALPIIGKNKLKPFDAYKKPYTYDAKKPVIALGITGIGLSSDLYDGIYGRLSPQVSLILSPYASNVDTISKAARGHGYEIWLQLPMETKEFPEVDPGSKAILANAGLKFNQDNYRSVLGATSGYAGIAAYTDSAFTNTEPMLTGILSEAFGRGLGYFEMNAGRYDLGLKVAIEARAPHIKSSMRGTPRTVGQHFAALKKKAQRDARAVGVIEVSPSMLQGFQRELIKAQNEGYEIVPLSALTDKY